MMNKSNHSFHMVDLSPWPLFISGIAFSLFLSIIQLIWNNSPNFLFANLMLAMAVSFLWWRDVDRESKLQGLHLVSVLNGLKLGMLLFIVSEVMFFLSFFWAFFHTSLTPNAELGSAWPPLAVTPFSYWEIPLLNTLILLISGITVTWSHASLISCKTEALVSLSLTVALGTYFTSLQALEYSEATYAFSDSTFGASFFIATGFHGLHIIVGTLFLAAILLRMSLNSVSNYHHFGFEAASWYWHFVDVVWLFLFTFIYWWILI